MGHKDSEARREYQRAWYAANREKHLERMRAWKAANREKHRASTRAWAAANRERKAIYNRAWDAANRDKRKAAARKYKTGCTHEQYQAKFEEQGGRCAVCGTDRCKTGRAFAADHCHKTGKQRGLLCQQCNTAIGKLGDNSAGLLKALSYLLAYEVECYRIEDTNDLNTSKHHHSENLQPTHERGGNDLRDVDADRGSRDPAPALAVGAGAGQDTQSGTGGGT